MDQNQNSIKWAAFNSGRSSTERNEPRFAGFDREGEKTKSSNQPVSAAEMIRINQLK